MNICLNFVAVVVVQFINIRLIWPIKKGDKKMSRLLQTELFKKEEVERFWEEIRQRFEHMHQNDRVDFDFPFPSFYEFMGACYYVQSDPELKAKYKSVKDIIQLTCMYPDVIEDIQKIVTSDTFTDGFADDFKVIMKKQAEHFMTKSEDEDAAENDSVWDKDDFDYIFREVIDEINRNPNKNTEKIGDLFYQGKEYVEKLESEQQQIKEMYHYLYLKMEENHDIPTDAYGNVTQFEEWYNEKDRKHTWKGYFDELESWCYQNAWGYMVHQVELKETRENINASYDAMKMVFDTVIFKPEWEKAKEAMMQFKRYDNSTQINYVKDMAAIFGKVVDDHAWFNNAFTLEILEYNKLIADFGSMRDLNTMYRKLYEMECDQNMIERDVDGNPKSFEETFPLESQSVYGLQKELTFLFNDKVYSNLVYLGGFGPHHLHDAQLFQDEASQAQAIVGNHFTIAKDIENIQKQLEQNTFEDVSNTLNTEHNKKYSQKVSKDLKKDILFDALQDFWIVERVQGTHFKNNEQWELIKNSVYSYCVADSKEAKGAEAQQMYYACRNYLNFHVKDLDRQKDIDGQLTLEGRLRKQAIVQILSIMEDYAVNNKDVTNPDFRPEFSDARTQYQLDTIIDKRMAPHLKITALERSLAKASKTDLKKTLPKGKADVKTLAYAELKELSKTYVDHMKKQVKVSKAKGTKIDMTVDPVKLMKDTKKAKKNQSKQKTKQNAKPKAMR